MDGSDDFYFDDITEADLAVAEEVESKFLESQRTQALQRKASQSQLPPAKRQKTTHTYETNGPVNPCETQLNATADPTGRLARSSSLHTEVAVLSEVPILGGYFTPVPRLNGNGRASHFASNYSLSSRRPSNRPDAYVPVHSTFASQLEHPLTAVRHLV